jgi:hypothetical protein
MSCIINALKTLQLTCSDHFDLVVGREDPTDFRATALTQLVNPEARANRCFLRDVPCVASVSVANVHATIPPVADGGREARVSIAAPIAYFCVRVPMRVKC